MEAAAKDFEEMKAELNEVIAGLQRRLMELSHSYSQTKGQLGDAQRQLAEARAEGAASSPSSDRTLELTCRLQELQMLVGDTENKYSAALQEISQLRQEAEVQAQSSVALADHTQVMASLGNAIKELELQSEVLKEQLHQKTSQVESLQSR